MQSAYIIQYMMNIYTDIYAIHNDTHTHTHTHTHIDTHTHTHVCNT